MPPAPQCPCPFFILLASVLLAAARLHGAENPIAADWLLQAAQVTKAPSASVTPAQDARGGCDGVMNGQFGFHTAKESNPWWQVDLERDQPIDRVVLWNRCDSHATRMTNFQLRLSADGHNWRIVYQNGGQTFLGFSDQKPWTVRLTNQTARFVRVQLPADEYLHLDEVQVFGPATETNLALHRPANQSSVSEWSVAYPISAEPDWTTQIARALQHAERLLTRRATEGIESSAARRRLTDLRAQPATETTYLAARALARELLLADPRLDFNDVLFVQRVPGTYSHMSDQYYGWWSRPGGGVFVLKSFKLKPELVCLTASLPPGSFLRPDLSYDGRKVLFAYCRHYPHVGGLQNKVAKDRIPEDAFYHVYEVNLDGSGLRQLTFGRYDDFDARYLPSGDIAFLSTRRGQFVQSTKHCLDATLSQVQPDSYVRCGGGDYRPVAVYTLHAMAADGSQLRPLSAFENFEWTPSVAADGRLLFARWDYVDRHNQPYMSLWAANPDGTNPQLVYGNFTRNPLAIFEARPIPHSRKLVFTASAHHSITAGSLVLFDPDLGNEDLAPLTRLTPEVGFPEAEGWPSTWYAGPHPLAEDLLLTAWSRVPLRHEGHQNATNGTGIYLYDTAGLRELIYRNETISSFEPIPVRARLRPPVLSSEVAWNGPQEGQMLVLNVYEGLTGVAPGSIKRLRIVAVPAKTQPQMNQPLLGLTGEDPGKCVLGTVPVEPDGSAFFRLPSGVNVFFQALNAEGVAVQTMRTITYVQPNQTLSCVGCHEHRYTAPRNGVSLAAQRPASKLKLGPDGSWPLRFDRLVQPVLDQHCVRCHQPGAEDAKAARIDLSPAKAYETLVSYGKPSLRDHVRQRWNEGRSIINQGPAQTSALLRYLHADATHQPISLDPAARERLLTWIDTYAQRLGSFSSDQESRLEDLKSRLSALLQTTSP